jgi:hypothetical protein
VCPPFHYYQLYKVKNYVVVGFNNIMLILNFMKNRQLLENLKEGEQTAWSSHKPISYTTKNDTVCNKSSQILRLIIYCGGMEDSKKESMNLP